jgi:hypothetical protein
MIRVGLLAVALALSACAPVDTPAPSSPQQADGAASACAAQGGSLERVGRAQTLQCVIAYADAGRACRDGSACLSGVCRGPVEVAQGANVTGQCQASNMAFGCYTRLTNGRAEAAICVD